MARQTLLFPIRAPADCLLHQMTLPIRGVAQTDERSQVRRVIYRGPSPLRWCEPLPFRQHHHWGVRMSWRIWRLWRAYWDAIQRDVAIPCLYPYLPKHLIALPIRGVEGSAVRAVSFWRFIHHAEWLLCYRKPIPRLVRLPIRLRRKYCGEHGLGIRATNLVSDLPQGWMMVLPIRCLALIGHRLGVWPDLAKPRLLSIAGCGLHEQYC